MQPGESSLLTRILAALAGVVLLVVGFMFSLVLLAVLAVLAVAGLVGLGWFWWKTRALRKTMKQRPADGHVIEGEAIVVEDIHSIRVVEAIDHHDKRDKPDKPDKPH
ncbi:hypothetical protein [Sulfuritalea sp.]|uniref:hypothetical protein n=1 Tax=Sulfuritalea sp. TaxID=2480090 RepID=UPI00286D743A|nr:hypothetical protein [Sulfuritalea sp.]